jgi:hypothetical protein
MLVLFLLLFCGSAVREYETMLRWITLIVKIDSRYKTVYSRTHHGGVRKNSRAEKYPWNLLGHAIEGK